MTLKSKSKPPHRISRKGEIETEHQDIFCLSGLSLKIWGCKTFVTKDFKLECSTSKTNVKFEGRCCGKRFIYTVELEWLEHFFNHENMFDTGVVRANECWL